jgi:hypothetical protein
MIIGPERAELAAENGNAAGMWNQRYGEMWEWRRSRKLVF